MVLEIHRGAICPPLHRKSVGLEPIGDRVNAYPTGKRFREIGLYVPARYRALTRNKKTASVLMEELKKKEDTLLLKLKVDNKDIMLLPVSM